MLLVISPSVWYIIAQWKYASYPNQCRQAGGIISFLATSVRYWLFEVRDRMVGVRFLESGSMGGILKEGNYGVRFCCD